MKVSGVLKFESLEGGHWLLEADNGERYQLDGLDPDLLDQGIRLEVEGEIDKQAVGIGMTGPFLVVKSARKL